MEVALRFHSRRVADSLQFLPTLQANSIDVVITDPPYGLQFMGKDWDAPWKDHQPSKASDLDGFRRAANPADVNRDDAFGRTSARAPEMKAGVGFQLWCEAWGRELLRVLKPGGFVLAFSGTRTSHRLTCGLEDAGFEIRDCVMWLYGSGFPKSMDISKAIDKAAGAKRERIRGVRSGIVGTDYAQDAWSKEFKDSVLSTEAITEAAKPWEGWGTALKPAYEPIIMAMKPCEGTFAANALKYGVAGLNIDECRVGVHVNTTPSGIDRINQRNFEQGYRPDAYQTVAPTWQRSTPTRHDICGGRMHTGTTDTVTEVGPQSGHPAGRWPANIILSHHPACVLVGTRTVKGDSRGNDPNRSAEHPPGKRASGFVNTGSETNVDGNGEPCARTYGDEAINLHDCHPDCPVRLLDEQAGTTSTTGNRSQQSQDATVEGTTWGTDNHRSTEYPGEAGGASRFFQHCEVDGESDEASECHPDCPVRLLNEQAGELKSGKPGVMRKGENDGAAYGAESRAGHAHDGVRRLRRRG